MIRIPRERYIVEAEDAPPELIYDTLIAPPVERIERRYTLDEIRYSPTVRAAHAEHRSRHHQLRNRIVGDSARSGRETAGDCRRLNRAIARNPREVFLIEGHTDAVGNDVDNLSLSDRRAESAAELLTQQFNVPAENLTSQGYGEQYLKVQTDGPSARQPPRHHPPHHAAAQRRAGLAAAAAARHRASAPLRRCTSNAEMAVERSRPFF